jgi:hypothetical protein
MEEFVVPKEWLFTCLDCLWVSDPEEGVDIDIIAYCEDCRNEIDDCEWEWDK